MRGLGLEIEAQRIPMRLHGRGQQLVVAQQAGQRQRSEAKGIGMEEVAPGAEVRASHGLFDVEETIGAKEHLAKAAERIERRVGWRGVFCGVF